MSSYAPDFADPFPRIRRERHVERKHPPREVKNFVAAGVAAALSSSLYNPFDCLKVRWQVLPTTSGEKSLMAFGLKIVREEGLINGLWRPGVGANALGMGLSSGIRFGYYEPVRNALMGDSQKSYQHMVLAGLVTGSVGYHHDTLSSFEDDDSSRKGIKVAVCNGFCIRCPTYFPTRWIDKFV
jgi:Mitochondrial carrier protein